MSGTKPFEYGILIQFKRYTYTVQIAIDIDSAAIAKRQTNNERWLNWDFYVTKSDLVAGTAKFPKTSVGTQEIIIDFPYEMRTVPVVLVSWKDTVRIVYHMDGLVVTEIGKTRFKVASERKIESYDWSFSYLAICR